MIEAPIIVEMVCEVSIAATVVTQPCTVTYVSTPPLAGIAFRIDHFAATLDIRFFGPIDATGLTVTHFADDISQPHALDRWGRCTIKVGAIDCRISAGGQDMIVRAR